METTKLKYASDLAIAYMIHKTLAPIRYPITLTITPIIAKKLFRR